MEQKTKKSRLLICIPMFVVAALILWYNIADANGFNTIWRYFGWANQSLSIFTFWALTVFLRRERKGLYYIITLIPAMFMTAICTTYIFVDKTCIGLDPKFGLPIALGTALIAFVLFLIWKSKEDKKTLS